MHLDFLKKFGFGNKKIARKLSEVILMKRGFWGICIHDKRVSNDSKLHSCETDKA